MDYAIQILSLISIYALLAVSLNLIAGHAGILNLAHAAFFGLGAYAYALTSSQWGLSFSWALGSGGLVAGLVAALVSWPLTRFRGDSVALATFAFQILTVSVIMNLTGVTGGPTGLPGVPQPQLPSFLPWNLAFLLLVFAFAVLAWLLVEYLGNSPFGRVLHALREDEVATAAKGKSCSAYKATIFIIGSLTAGLAGGLYAAYMMFIDPSSFDIGESIFLLSAVIIGGSGSRWGPWAGISLLIVMPEALRFSGIPANVAANLRQVIYGIALVALMLLRPHGLAGRYGFQ